LVYCTFGTSHAAWKHPLYVWRSLKVMFNFWRIFTRLSTSASLEYVEYAGMCITLCQKSVNVAGISSYIRKQYQIYKEMTLSTEYIRHCYCTQSPRHRRKSPRHRRIVGTVYATECRRR
jgi:hypothetical protein